MIRLINLSSSQTVSQEHLPLQANGYHCTSEMLYDVLMKAASENISIDAACRDLEQSASGNRIREYLNEQLNVEQLDQYEHQINEALAAHLPQQLQSHRVEAAIDEHDEPCYAKTPKLRMYTCRSKPKAGTSRFFLLGFALLLANIWAFLRWFVARNPGRGPHPLDPTRFQFQTFVSMLRRSIETLYGAVMTIPMPLLSMKS